MVDRAHVTPSAIYRCLYNIKKPQVFLGVLVLSITLLWISFQFVTSGSKLLRQRQRNLEKASSIWNENDYVKNVADLYPNLPIEFWMQVRNKTWNMFLKNRTCALFPDVFTLHVEESYWQTLDLSNSTTLHLYSAYYDCRNITLPQNFVRILAVANKTNEDFQINKNLFCQLWYDTENEPVISPIVEKDYGWREFWKTHQNGMEATFLLGCIAPEKNNTIPRAVSLVERPCHRAKNLLNIIYNKGTRSKNVAVCVKGLDFLQTDISLRLLEWIEFILLMGVDVIYFYKLELHPNAAKVIDYYVKLGKIDIRESTLPPGQPNIPFLRHSFLSNNIQKSLNEIILYNDCFYRLLYTYKYVCLLDIDEIILPMQDSNWNDLIERLEKQLKPNETAASYNVRNSFFLDNMTPEGGYSDIPNYMHMLQHVHRSQNFTPQFVYVKSFFNTEEVLLCHNHLPFISSNRSLFAWEVPLSDAQMNHYRSGLNSDLQDKSYGTFITKDTSLWKYKDYLISRTNKVLSELNL